MIPMIDYKQQHCQHWRFTQILANSNGKLVKRVKVAYQVSLAEATQVKILGVKLAVS